MTPDAKKALSTTIRAARTRLLDDLHATTEATYRLGVRRQDAGLGTVEDEHRARLEAWTGEQVRGQGTTKGRAARSREDFRPDAQKQAAYTWINRWWSCASWRRPACVRHCC